MSGARAVAGGSFAWTPADDGWGHSNAGLVVADGVGLLVDTLFDLPRTRRMLDDLAAAGGIAVTDLAYAVNTHGNGDHWFGNAALPDDVRIVAAAGSVRDMEAVGPATVASLQTIPGPIGGFTRDCFGAFAFDEFAAAPGEEGVTPRLPDDTFGDSTVLTVGGLDLLLLDLGPAHTAGDTVVVCERDGVVFTGDLVFAGGTPIMWDGPVEHWLRACERLRALGRDLGVTHLVPGHGPVSPIARVGEMADYLAFVAEEARARHARGMDPLDAAADIDLGVFAELPERERLAANVLAIYRALDAGPAPTGPEMFGCMAELLGRWARHDDQED